MTLPVRRSARLVLLDSEDRLLLFRYHDEHKPPFWSTAGGELKEGESYEMAAARELKEETGFTAPIGQLLRERDDVYPTARSTPARWLERYFLVRCDGTPSREGWSEEERETIQNWKWWSLNEMRTTDETFLPSFLPDLLHDTIELRAEAESS